MSFIFKLTLAAGLFVIGAVKVWIHSTALSGTLVQLCSGRTMTLPLDAGFLDRAHCWGCYVAAAGLLYFAFALIEHLRTTNDAQETCLS